MKREAQRILVSNDHPEEVGKIVEILGNEGYDVLAVESLKNLIESAVATSPDVIVLGLDDDNDMALSMCERLRRTSATQDVPVILQTATYRDVDRIVEGLSRGAFDYLIKPYHWPEFLARVGVMARISSILKRERRLAATDDLTGLLNRRVVLKRLHEELERTARYATPLSCVMLDIDHFKDVNDTFGHLVGDRVLREVASITQECKRIPDLVGRYGGEEFLMLLPETDAEGAVSVAERVRKRINTRTITDTGREVRVTASLGGATCSPGCKANADDLIRQADEALYQAKHAGRNRVVHAEFSVSD